MRLALKVSKYTVTQSSSLTRFVGSMKSDMKTWYPITTTIYMTDRFRNFYIDHVPRQQNVYADALASLAASLALSARAAEKVLIYSYDLYCLRFIFRDNQKQAGDLQVKEALETSTGLELRDWRFPYIDYALYDILPEDPKEAAAIRRKAPKFYYNAITRTLYR